jgi:glycyl-tRNA synthetase beta chain
VSEHSALLIEIGCEEIPARMIPAASRDFAAIVIRILDDAGLEHGASVSWGGSRRLAVRVEGVAAGQADRNESVLGPPAKVAFTPEGKATPAAIGFAKKQGIAADQLATIETDRGSYVGFDRVVKGKSVGELLARDLQPGVSAMRFPKVMRWADGTFRWVRPVHWVLALHGKAALELSLFDVAASRRSRAHRFLGPGEVEVGHPDDYGPSLEAGFVVVDPAERRRRLASSLDDAARRMGGEVVEDPGLLEEVADLIEWPGVVAGSFDPAYLELPLELLVTTLRHHQKCFSVKAKDGALSPHFLAVANTDRDPRGHVRRGNEWVIGGRLDDARFFWREDRRKKLQDRSEELERVILHAKLGSYAEKSRRVAEVAVNAARRLEMAVEQVEHCRVAASLAKNDLVTGTVGEFPELQGRIGGLLLRAEGEPEAVAKAVYEQYQPVGPDDDVPQTACGAVVAIADKLDSVAGFVGIGKGPTGSGDPFGLRRATGGIFRIAVERELDLSLEALAELGGGGGALLDFLRERMEKFFRDLGYSANEIRSVTFVDGGKTCLLIPLSDVLMRLEAVRGVRERADFARLVELTKRIFNIVPKITETLRGKVGDDWLPAPECYEEFADPTAPGRRLRAQIETAGPEIDTLAGSKDYPGVIDLLADFVEPVAGFFDDVLVIDPDHPSETHHRGEMLGRLGSVLTRYFDIRELAGQADRRA